MPVAVKGDGIHRCLKEDTNVNAITKLLDYTQKITLPSFPLKWDRHSWVVSLSKLFWTFIHISRLWTEQLWSSIQGTFWNRANIPGHTIITVSVRKLSVNPKDTSGLVAIWEPLVIRTQISNIHWALHFFLKVHHFPSTVMKSLKRNHVGEILINHKLY